MSVAYYRKYAMAKLKPNEILEILSRYQNGEGTTILGLTFGVDHSTIYYYIKKHAIVREVTFPFTRIDPYERAQLRMNRPREVRDKRPKNPPPVCEAPPKPYHLAILEEKVCHGKSYAQYVAETKERERRARFPQLYKKTSTADV